MTDGVLVYDDDCGFCTWWVEFFEARSDVSVVGFSELDPGLEGRLPPGYERCAHLLTRTARYSCGAAMEEAFVRSSVGHPFRSAVEFARRFDAYTAIREGVYRWVANNRALLGNLVSRPPPARARNAD